MRRLVSIVSVVLITCIVAELGIRTGLLESLETVYSDFWHRLAGLRVHRKHTAIVAIDDVTLLDYKDDPLAFWSPYLAKAIGVLRQAGVAMIGLDLILSVSAESWLKKLNLPGNDISRTYDLPFRSQLARGQVVLTGMVAYNDRGEGEYRLSLDEYILMLPAQLNDVGLINVYSDADGVTRHFTPAFFGDGRVPDLGFATLLAIRSAGLDPNSNEWTLSGVKIPKTFALRPIGFVGPPHSIPRLSFARLIRSDADLDPEIQRLKGKVVIIALESTDTQDIHLTPYSRSLLGWEGRMMSGPELQANIIETLLTGRFPRPISPWFRMLYLIGWLSLATWLFFSVSPWKGISIGVLLGVLCPLPAYVLFRSDWILPVATVQMAMALSYLGTLGFRLTGEERKQARLRRIFGQFVSDDVVDHLVKTGKSPHLGGEAFQVTVLFSDIRNFTTISEKLTPPEVVEMLNAYLSKVCELILAQGGMINKFIGDAVMAVFGAPASFPDHSMRAIRAALAMRKVAEEFRTWMQARFPGKDLPEFRIGIGLHTGEAVMGNIGSAKRMEYTAIGDTVNTASRLESASKELGWTIVASAETIQATGTIVLTGGHDTIQVKGKGQAVEVFEVVGVKL